MSAKKPAAAEAALKKPDKPVALKTVGARKVISTLAKADPRKFVDYTVHAFHGDGSTKVVGTTDNFEDTDALKTMHAHVALASGHGIPKFKVIERDYDETRDPSEHMIESEVA